MTTPEDLEQAPISAALSYQQGDYAFLCRQPDFVLQTPLRPATRIEADFIVLYPNGKLWLKNGYASDGPSGLPLWDRRYFTSLLKGAFGHDGLYQLIRLEKLPEDARALADQFLKEQWLADGVPAVFAASGVAIVQRVGDRYAKGGTEPAILVAP